MLIVSQDSGPDVCDDPRHETTPPKYTRITRLLDTLYYPRSGCTAIHPFTHARLKIKWRLWILHSYWPSTSYLLPSTPAVWLFLVSIYTVQNHHCLRCFKHCACIMSKLGLCLYSLHFHVKAHLCWRPLMKPIPFLKSESFQRHKHSSDILDIHRSCDMNRKSRGICSRRTIASKD